MNPSLHIEYKRSHVKQYFKEERALRTETTINDPGDFNLNKGLKSLPTPSLSRYVGRFGKSIAKSERCAKKPVFVPLDET